MSTLMFQNRLAAKGIVCLNWTSFWFDGMLVLIYNTTYRLADVMFRTMPPDKAREYGQRKGEGESQGTGFPDDGGGTVVPAPL
jgi:hypothetical protein